MLLTCVLMHLESAFREGSVIADYTAVYSLKTALNGSIVADIKEKVLPDLKNAKIDGSEVDKEYVDNTVSKEEIDKGENDTIMS